MMLVRDVFQAKYGTGGDQVALFQEARRTWPAVAQHGLRLLTDARGPFFTVVTETEVASLAEWEQRSAQILRPARFRGLVRPDAAARRIRAARVLHHRTVGRDRRSSLGEEAHRAQGGDDNAVCGHARLRESDARRPPVPAGAGAREEGHEVGLLIVGDAVVLLKDAVAKATIPVGWPPVGEVFARLIEHRVPVSVCGGGSVARGVTDADLPGQDASFVTPTVAAQRIAGADRALTFSPAQRAGGAARVPRSLPDGAPRGTL